MKPTKQEVYVPVSIDTELPELGVDVLAFNYGDNWQSECKRIEMDFGKVEWVNSWHEEYICYPTHWLKKQEKYVFSEEELRALLNDIWQLSDKYGYTLISERDECINNLLKQ